MPTVDLLKSYDRKKAVCEDTFLCRTCEQSLSAVAFEKHAKTCLGLNSRTHCVWCLGETSWPSKSKGRHRDHLLDCFEACPFRQRAAPLPPPTPGVVYHYITKPLDHAAPVVPLGLNDNNDDDDDDDEDDGLFLDPFCDAESFILDTDPEPLCPERDLFGYPRLSELLPDLAYELFNVLDLPVPALPFQDEHLNRAIGCMQAFFELRDTHDFVHCMVRAVAFTQFIAVMMHSSYGRKIRMLPFSCWCNGGDYAEARHRQHRHMILVVPKNISKAQWQKHVWGKLYSSKDRPRDTATGKPMVGFKCHLKRAITDPMHLLNALGYLSDRKSRCNGILDEQQQQQQSRRRSVLKRNHFWIFTSLPAYYRLPLAMQWDGGLMQLVHQQFRYAKLTTLVDLPRCREDGRWKIQVKDLPGLTRRLVMPVAKTYRPCVRPTFSTAEASRCYLHLSDGQKVYFEEDAAASLSELDEAAWGRVQADAGNVFFDRIGDMKWTPGKFQQKCLNAIDFYRVRFEGMREALEKSMAMERVRVCQELSDGRRQVEAEKLRAWEECTRQEQRLRAAWEVDHDAEVKRLRAAWEVEMDAERVAWRAEVAALREAALKKTLESERVRWEELLERERTEKAEWKEALEACRRANLEAEVAHLRETVARLTSELAALESKEALQRKDAVALRLESKEALARKDAELVAMREVLEKKKDAEMSTLKGVLEKLRLEAVQRESESKVRALEEACRAKDVELAALRAEQQRRHRQQSGGGGRPDGFMRGRKRRRSLGDEAEVSKSELKRSVDRLEREMDEMKGDWWKRRRILKLVV